MNLSGLLRSEAVISEKIDATDSSVSVMFDAADCLDELAQTLEQLLASCAHIQQIPLRTLTRAQDVITRVRVSC